MEIFLYDIVTVIIRGKYFGNPADFCHRLIFFFPFFRNQRRSSLSVQDNMYCFKRLYHRINKSARKFSIDLSHRLMQHNKQERVTVSFIISFLLPAEQISWHLTASHNRFPIFIPAQKKYRNFLQSRYFLNFYEGLFLKLPIVSLETICVRCFLNGDM